VVISLVGPRSARVTAGVPVWAAAGLVAAEVAVEVVEEAAVGAEAVEEGAADDAKR
jgi:hypothetical protein